MAQQQEKDLDLDVESAGAGSNKMKMTIIVLVVLVLLGGGGAAAYYFLVASDGEKADAQKKEGPKPAQYHALDPAFVVNFKQGGTDRYLKVGVTLMSRNKEKMEALKRHDPLIRNKLVGIFSSQTFADLQTQRGKDKMRQEALEALRKLLKAETGAPVVERILFTEFVMQ